MKARQLATTVALSLTLVTALAPTAPALAADSSDFRGTWYAVDHVDGSNTYLTIGPRGNAILFDDAATVCDGAPAIATARPGSIDGDRLHITYRVHCFNRISVPDFPTYLQAEPDGTLTSEPDGTGFDTYTRL